MTETEFFERLEYRVCEQLRDHPHPAVPGLWCDGLIREDADFTGLLPALSGIAWFGGLPGEDPARYQEKWRFELTVNLRLETLDSVRWASLFPGPGARGWLDLNVPEKLISFFLQPEGSSL